MAWIASFLASVFSSSAGKSLASWILSKLWGYASSEMQDYLAHQRWEKHLKVNLEKYEKLILEYDNKIDSGQTLTEEEINELRRKKIEIEKDIINAKP